MAHLRKAQLETPVVFIIFNRPDFARQVFQRIRDAAPRKLLAVADGPRADRPGEAELCEQTRAILREIDWECEVLTNFAPRNLGTRPRFASAFKWIFSQVEEAIFLDHDCVPDPSFFPYEVMRR